ncbi:MAG TPA: adenylate/guanylate cyclase domain-containing protein [Thermohalobaculum sp.]|nr:adenylate/guanylate cyclase domain-containing protein [Thermohalobaculum sp.]
MPGKRVERRLAAILAADVAGFSRLMGVDEAGTLEALKTLHREVFAPRVREHRGRIVKLMGDGALVEFASVVDAVTAAVAIQEGFAERTAETPENTRIALRIGINLGDVIIEGADIYGDGVNVAARLQALATPGGIALSATAHEHVAGKVGAAFTDGGTHELKNIAAPVRVFFWSGAAPAPAPDAPALPDKPSIVVLPFDNMSGDPAQDYFADGVVEALTAALSRIRAFFVIARNSAFAYKGRAMNVREIGRELGVAYVLEGSVQRAGNRVRITVQLIETQSGNHLWAERYDGDLDDIFDLQDKITEQVAGALQPSIRLAEIERARRKRPEAMGAYDYTMRAVRHVWMLEKDEATRALELLEKALEIDPDYPLALALAGWCWAQRTAYGWMPDRDASIAEALRLAEKAANAGNDDPLTLTVLGTVHTIARNRETARLILERAIAIDPNSSWAWSRLGWLDAYCGRLESAEQNLRRSIRLSPLDPMIFNNYAGLGVARSSARDYAGAVVHFERALRERPGANWIRRILAACLMGAGREAEAREVAAEMMRRDPGFTIRGYKAGVPSSDEHMNQIAALMTALGLPQG